MRTVEEYIISIDAKSAGLVCYFRSLILSCSRKIEEEATLDKLLFYHNNFLICSINKTIIGIELEFNYGEYIIDPCKTLLPITENTYKTPHLKTTKQIDAYQLIVLVKQVLLFCELKDIEFKHELKQLSK